MADTKEEEGRTAVRPRGALWRLVDSAEKSEESAAGKRAGEGEQMDVASFIAAHGLEFSRFKFGDRALARNYGRAIAAQIMAELPGIRKRPARYVLLRPHAKNLPRSGTMLWEAVRDELSAKAGPVGVGLIRTTRHVGTNYSHLSCDKQRLSVQRSFGLTWDESFSPASVLQDAEVVIFLDDTIVSGGTMLATREVVEGILGISDTWNDRFVAFTIIDFTKTSESSLEGHINQLAFQASDSMVVPRLVESLGQLWEEGGLPSVGRPRFVMGSLSSEQRIAFAATAGALLNIWLLHAAVLDGLHEAYPESFVQWLGAIPRGKELREPVMAAMALSNKSTGGLAEAREHITCLISAAGTQKTPELAAALTDFTEALKKEIGAVSEPSPKEVMSEFPQVFGPGGSAVSSVHSVDGTFPHTLQIVQDAHGKNRLQIAVTPKNPSEVRLIAVHYGINGSGETMNFDIRYPNGDTYVHTTPDFGPVCNPGDKVTYWLAGVVKGLIQEMPAGACPNPDARLYWTAA